MNTSHQQHRRKKTILYFVLKAFRLQSALAIILTFLLYTALSAHLFTPSIIEVREEEGFCSFLSTDLKDPMRSSLEHSIQNAKESVVLIIYSLSDKKLVNSLRYVANRGVPVMVIHDSVETPDCAFLLGKNVKCYPRRGQGLMHNKLLVIDHSIVWLGSANMSTRSLTEQGNLVVALRCRAIAETIEALAASMISRSAYLSPPLHVEFPQSHLTLFFHPFHGKLAFRSLIERIDTASKRIFVAMFTFTHPDLISALCRAKDRGVDVRIVLDKDSSTQTSKKAYVTFKRKGIHCGYRTKTGLLHYKTAIIDNALVTGSCNWTKAGFASNHEAMLFIEPLTPVQHVWIDRWWSQVEHFSSLP
jgi:phosphatidylserine/phosphatidylglycerophosphate/cardiolipin synthase-like enzyme